LQLRLHGEQTADLAWPSNVASYSALLGWLCVIAALMSYIQGWKKHGPNVDCRCVKAPSFMCKLEQRYDDLESNCLLILIVQSEREV